MVTILIPLNITGGKTLLGTTIPSSDHQFFPGLFDGYQESKTPITNREAVSVT
jgi:hypothetical protein